MKFNIKKMNENIIPLIAAPAVAAIITLIFLYMESSKKDIKPYMYIVYPIAVALLVLIITIFLIGGGGDLFLMFNTM